MSSGTAAESSSVSGAIGDADASDAEVDAVGDAIGCAMNGGGSSAETAGIERDGSGGGSVAGIDREIDAPGDVGIEREIAAGGEAAGIERDTDGIGGGCDGDAFRGDDDGSISERGDADSVCEHDDVDSACERDDIDSVCERDASDEERDAAESGDAARAESGSRGADDGSCEITICGADGSEIGVRCAGLIVPARGSWLRIGIVFAASRSARAASREAMWRALTAWRSAISSTIASASVSSRSRGLVMSADSSTA